jgi:hypothetical protein
MRSSGGLPAGIQPSPIRAARLGTGSAAPQVILPLTVLRRFDCLLAPTKALEG